jgi:hypothetical protein
LAHSFHILDAAVIRLADNNVPVGLLDVALQITSVLIENEQTNDQQKMKGV